MVKPKKILITGATSGVGLLLAQKMYNEEYEVWATGRNETVLVRLEELGINPLVADLTKERDYDEMFQAMGVPDVVVHCAGVGIFAALSDIEEADIETMMQVNVVAPMLLTKYFAEKMKQNGHGHIVFVSSQAGKVATPKASVYAASKHAINGFANAIRMELKEAGIFVTTINPGPIDTPFLDLADQTGNYRERLGKYLLTPVEVVDAIIKSIKNPVREVDIPSYMSLTSKLYAVFPNTVERLGKGFFHRK